MEPRLRAFELFAKMKPGQVLVIREIAKKDPQSFIGYAKEYIESHTWDYEFNFDFSKFKRLSPIT